MPNKDSTPSWPEARPYASQVVIDRLAALAWASIAAGAMDGAHYTTVAEQSRENFKPASLERAVTELIKKTKESGSAAGKGSSAGSKESSARNKQSSAGNKESVGKSHEGKEEGGVGAGKGRKRKAGCDWEEGGGGGGGGGRSGGGGKKGKKGSRGGVVGEKKVVEREEADEDEKGEEEEGEEGNAIEAEAEEWELN